MKAEQEAQQMIISASDEDHHASPGEIQDMFGIAEGHKEEQETKKLQEEE